MSIRSLVSTAISSTESTIQGIVSLGSVVGDGTSWLKRQSSRINSDEVVRVEEAEFRFQLAERKAALVNRAKAINAADVISEFEELEKLLK